MQPRRHVCHGLRHEYPGTTDRMSWPQVLGILHHPESFTRNRQASDLPIEGACPRERSRRLTVLSVRTGTWCLSHDTRTHAYIAPQARGPCPSPSPIFKTRLSNCSCFALLAQRLLILSYPAALCPMHAHVLPHSLCPPSVCQYAELIRSWPSCNSRHDSQPMTGRITIRARHPLLPPPLPCRPGSSQPRLACWTPLWCGS